MSDFLAEARVVVRPDTTQFRAQLQESVRRAISQTQVPPILVPIAFGAAGTGLAGITASTAALAAVQGTAEASSLGLAKAAQIENSAFGRQAVILTAAADATLLKAGADKTATSAALGHAAAQGQVAKAAVASGAGMLGLRGAVLTAGTAFIAATVGFQALGKAVGSAVSFERELNVFQVTAGATADQMARVQDVARELGRDITLPGVAANDAAQALSLLARAGLSVEDSLNAVRGTLQLATAAEIENAAAAELVANALNSFKLDGQEATRVADLLAGAANQSQGSITDMGLALKQTSAIASGLGISIEDTITILTQLSRAGLSASDAGTSFRQTLLRLIQDLPKVRKEVDRLGLDLRDASGNIRPEVFEELGRKLKTLTPAARQLAIANLGGADAIRTLLVLTRAQAGEFDNVQRAVTQAGLAQEFAAARTEGLGGDVEAAKNEFADLGLTVGKAASGPLSLFVRTAGAAAGAVNDLVSSVEKTEGGQGFFSALGDAADGLQDSFAKMNLSFREGVKIAALGRTEFSGLANVLRDAASGADALAAALKGAARETLAKQGDPGEGLNVQGVLDRVAGLDAEEVRARIRGDNDGILAVLAQEQAFFESQLQRQFVRNRPALRRSLEQALLGTVNDIASIQKQGATAAKSAAVDAASAQQEANQELLALQANRRADVERAGEQAEVEGNLQRAIRFEDRLQALIKKQIEKVRNQIKDEKARAAAVRELRLALIASRREEDALRQERAQAIAANKAEAINLDIDFAETIGNVNREIAARLRLIALLKKQQAAVKKGSNEWKRLRNEIAAQQQAIKEAKNQADDNEQDGQSAQQFFFEQLQAQQGFAANLMGNLITGPTAGLVGVPSPVGQQIRTESAAAEGRAALPPTSGQSNTEIDVLRRILMELRRLNGSYDAPEAITNKKSSMAIMDGIGGV